MSFQDQLVTPYCFICDINSSNIAFDCGHITTCENCTFEIQFCIECYQPVENRVRVTYYEQLKAVLLEKVEQNEEQ